MPQLIQVTAGKLDQSGEIAQLVADVRREADAFVLLSGGASEMSEDHRRQVLELMNALTILADRGVRLAVVDGGTKAGLMEAAGHARASARSPFPLVGVAPASEVITGKTPVDPNHSHIVAVDNPGWTDARAWGSEVDTMFELSGRLAEGRAVVVVVANGGSVTLQEVAKSVHAGRPIILIAGSGRATDALVSLLQGTVPGDDDVRTLRESAEGGRLIARPELYDVFPKEQGAAALADRIAAHLVR